MELNFKGDLKELVKLPNIAEKLDDQDLKTIGLECKLEFEQDKTSRADWEEWYAEAMKLALQVMEDKTYPWPNCSNVKFPLLTIAAINFHARAFPTIVNGKEVVTYKVFGDDKDGEKAERAARITAHQNYMLLEATDWEEHEDKALIVTPIMGCCFKKIFGDSDTGLARSILILPQNLVVPYYTASIEDSPRVSETFSLQPNAFVTKKRRKLYLDIDYYPNYNTVAEDALMAAQRDSQHVSPVAFGDDSTPIALVEQHRFLDLDGDGYREPYIVTFCRDTGQVCRIVARYQSPDIEYGKGADRDKVIYISANHFYEKKPFIPSPDGGFYDLGFGLLLGPLNQACDSLINQLIDAGTMHNMGGGFLGRGVKIRKGETTFIPNEWKTVESSGAALKDNIVPLPVRNPSDTLLQLLTFLVQYAERISSANEVQMGEVPTQNMKAEVMNIANQNGIRIFTAIYKRWWRSTKREFKKLYKATAIAQMTDKGIKNGEGAMFGLKLDDYRMPAEGITPTADPNIASQELAVQRAREVMSTVQSIPGQNVWAATIRYYKALGIERPEEIFPDPKGQDAIQVGPDPKAIDANARMLTAQANAQEKSRKHMLAVNQLMQEATESQAKVLKMQAEARKLHAEADSVPVGHAIALLDTQIGAEKHHLDGILKVIDLLKGDSNGPDTGTTPGAIQPGGGSVLPLAGTAGKPAVLPLSQGQEGASNVPLGG